jgi:hypothetical protein
MTRDDAIDDLLTRLAAARGAANDLGMDVAAYLLNLAMLEVLERGTPVIPPRAVRRIDLRTRRGGAARVVPSIGRLRGRSA